MTTPVRFPEVFDMTSARREPDAGPLPGPRSGVAPTPSAAASRDIEQRFAKLVAESEYKLLEEKAKAHEREAKLKEELARERAGMPKLVDQQVEKILRERGVAQVGAGAPPVGAAEGSTERQLRQQLAETQRLLADSERRYQQERRELLNLRTNQLKNETTKRGQEGDIIGRAMQVMSEYEQIVRSSEENSLARLAHHMEAFEKEWVQRSKEFEDKKSDFEMSIMTKAIDSLRKHNQDVESIGNSVTNKVLDMLKEQSAQRMQLEQEILVQSENFKLQYRDMLDKEFKERCRQYDETIAVRERDLIKIVSAERDRIISVEKEAVEKMEVTHVQALTEAMKDISALREQLVREHEQQQSTAVTELLARREEMRNEQNAIIQQANERVGKIEAQCFEAVESAQKSLKTMQAQIAQREAEVAQKLISSDSEREHLRLQQMSQLRQEIEAEWKRVVEELRQHHLEELQRLDEGHQERLDRDASEAFRREEEIRRTYDGRIAKVEEAAEARWKRRLEEEKQSNDRQAEVIQVLREDNEQLSVELSNLQQKFFSQESEFSTKVAALQREQEQVWHRKLEEMRMRYDKLLDETLGGGTGENVTRQEYDKVVQSLRELEERCVEMRRTEGERLSRERSQLNEMWRGRLDQERQERAIWEEDQLKKLVELRVELEGDIHRKETELLRRVEQERLKLHELTVKRSVEGRRERELFEEGLREEYNAKLLEAEEELKAAYASKVKSLEQRFETKETEIEKRRRDLRSEQLDYEVRVRAQAEEWSRQQQESFLIDVKRAHEQLEKDREKMEQERATLERSAQVKYAELFQHGKAELQRKMLEVFGLQVEHWEEREGDWLAFRSEEMSILFGLRSEHEQKMLQFVEVASKAARAEANSILEKERAILDAKEANLFAEVEKSRLAQEAASRERALHLLDERNKIQEEAEKARAIEEARLWEELERKVLEKERLAEQERRVLELDLRSRYEAMINSEKTRVDALMETHRREAQELYEKHEQTLRERETEWHKQRLEIELEERTAHERQFNELRHQSEIRVSEERKRFEEALKSREAEFEEERQRILSNFQRQFTQSDQTTKDQLNTLKEEYENRMRTLSQEAQHQRESYLADIAEQERRFQVLRDEYELEASRKFNKATSELRSQIEKRTKEQQARELEARDASEKDRRRYEEAINAQYEALLKEHEQRLMALQKQREERILELQKEYQANLLAKQHEMERSLSSYFADTESRAKDATESIRKEFQQKIDEFRALADEERKKRTDSENQLHNVREDLETLRSTVEQHKLEEHRSVQTKYEKLFGELREKYRLEKEDAARKEMEEEEKRLARELVKRDTEFQKESHPFSTPKLGFHMDPTPTVIPVSSVTPSAPRSASATTASEEHVVTTSETIARRREKLLQLWQVLDFPAAQRTSFLERVHVLSAPRALDEINSEIKKLEVQLPLLEVVTRREFVQHRLQEAERGGNAKQRDDLRREIVRLNEHLKAEIPKHEQRYNSKFLFRGQRYLDVLLGEEHQMTFRSSSASGDEGPTPLFGPAPTATKGAHRTPSRTFQ